MGKRPCQTPAWLIVIISDPGLSKNSHLWILRRDVFYFKAMPEPASNAMELWYPQRKLQQTRGKTAETHFSVFFTCFCKNSCSLQNPAQTPDLISCHVFATKWHFAFVLMTGYEPMSFCGLPEELSRFTPFCLLLSALSHSRVVGSKSTFISPGCSPGQKRGSRDPT